MSFREDLIFITTYGIDISILEESTEVLQEQLLDFLLEHLPTDMYAFKDNGVSYDVNNLNGDIRALIEERGEELRRRRVIFLKENEEILDKEKAGQFIVKTANFFGQLLQEKLTKE